MAGINGLGSERRSEPGLSGKHGLAGKYLTFSLEGEEYAVGILQVTEIIGLMKIRTVPGMPHDVKGVINLRSRIIPVVDLRSRFGMPEAEPTNRTCIIIVELPHDGGSISVGMIVDSVTEVAEFTAKQLESTSHGEGHHSSKILGIAKYDDGQVVMLLDIANSLGDSATLLACTH